MALNCRSLLCRELEELFSLYICLCRFDYDQKILVSGNQEFSCLKMLPYDISFRQTLRQRPFPVKTYIGWQQLYHHVNHAKKNLNKGSCIYFYRKMYKKMNDGVSSPICSKIFKA